MYFWLSWWWLSWWWVVVEEMGRAGRGRVDTQEAAGRDCSCSEEVGRESRPVVAEQQ